MVIDDRDDEKTLVDARFAVPDHTPREEPQARWRGASAWLRRRRRRIAEAGAVLALVLGLGAVAYQQSREVDALRERIDAMKRDRSGSFVGGLARSSSSAPPPVGAEATSNPSSGEVTQSERESLERRGAMLIGSNDFSCALPHYRMLTELFPQQRVFRDVVTVLEAKLRRSGSVEPASGSCP